MQTINQYRDKLIQLKTFKNSLSGPDKTLLNKFELVLTDTELEIRGGTAKQQSKLLKDRFRIQKIATSMLNVEVAMYGSVFSFYANDRIGVFE